MPEPGEEVAHAQGQTSPADDIKCGVTPSGGCVVGRCLEACFSWVPVPLFGLSSWLAGLTEKLFHDFLYIELKKTNKTRQDRVGQGRAGNAR